jgi:hypothetical protein
MFLGRLESSSPQFPRICTEAASREATASRKSSGASCVRAGGNTGPPMVTAMDPLREGHSPSRSMARVPWVATGSTGTCAARR